MAIQRFAGTRRLIFIILLPTVLLFGCMPYQLKAVLDGPQGQGLSISPSATVVATSGTFTFTASGGVGPYTYVLLSGGGSVDPVTGLYMAPATAGSAVVRVTDTTGKSVDAVVTVDLPPDYKVSLSVTIPWSGVVSGAMSATGTTQITIQNVSANPGHANINWFVYLSPNNVLDPGDTLIQQGTIGPLAAGASTPVTFAGAWPAVTGVYYLIAAIQSSDDSNVANNVVIGHLTAIGDYRYQQGAEVNNGAGPFPGTLSALTTSDTGLNGALNLGANQTLVVEGVIGAAGQDGTFRFTLAAGLGTLNVQSLWVTGFDDIDTFVWDSTGLQFASNGPGIDMEPDPVGTFSIPTPAAGVWYVGENFFLAGGAGSTGKKFVILIKGLP